MKKKGAKRVEIAGVDDKCQIMAVFAATAVGEFLPVQLIYQRKTSTSLPAFTLPDDWSVMYTPNRWANEQTTKTYIEKIILPYMRERWQQLDLEGDHPALVIFDVFKSQCTPWPVGHPRNKKALTACLAFKDDPAKMVFCQATIRNQLLKCFESKQLTQF